MDNNGFDKVRTNSPKKKRWLAMDKGNLHDYIHVSIALWTSLQCVFGGEYGLEIPVNSHYYEPEKAIKLAKK